MTFSSCVNIADGGEALEVCVYLFGGERGRAAVSSVILAVGPVVGGVTPAVPSKRLHTSYKQETVLQTEK